jgi:hypothetical protein
MIHSRKTRDAIESCRPGSADLAAPEMAKLAAEVEQDPAIRAEYERVQRQDGTVARAFEQVPIPEGLPQRLLAALAASADSASSAQVMNATEETILPAAPPAPVTSRRWWIASISVAATALIATGLCAWWFWKTPLTSDQLAQKAQQWTDEVLGLNESSWKPFDSAQFPDLHWQPSRQRVMSTSLDPQAYVFDFRSGGNSRLLLFRVKTSQTIPLPNLPYLALSSTGAWRQGAWREGDVIFVAVTNDPRILDWLRRGVEAT